MGRCDGRFAQRAAFGLPRLADICYDDDLIMRRLTKMAGLEGMVKSGWKV